jgi:hypothetical protein
MSVLLLALAVGTGNGEEKRFEKKFSVTPGGVLTLETDAGSVKVTGTTGNEVVVLARIEGRSRDVEKFTIEAEQVSGGVQVSGKGEKNFWRFLSGHNFDVEFTVSVPREYNIHVHTSGGDVVVSDVKGKVDGGTSGGNVSLKQIEGASTVETSGGDIRAEALKGNIHAETSGGNVLVKKVTGSVGAETSGGNISVEEVDGKVQAETSGGDIHLSVLGTNRGIHAETSGGNVTIAIAKSVAAMIDASTSGGDVICDMPVTVSGKISESRIKGTLNGGGELIYAHTSGGNVRIKPLD